MTDLTQYPMPVGMPTPQATTPGNTGIMPPGMGSPGPNMHPTAPRPGPGPVWEEAMRRVRGGENPPHTAAPQFPGVHRGRFLSRLIEQHPDFLTNHPRIAERMGVGAPPVTAPATTAPAPGTGIATGELTSPQANIVGGLPQAGAAPAAPTVPVYGNPRPRTMAGPTGSGVAMTSPGLTSGASAILNARTQTARRPNPLHKI